MIVHTDTGRSYLIPRTREFQVFRKGASGHEQHEYRLFLYTPEEPPPPGGYAVVFLLDANSCFGSFVEMVRLQTRKPHGYDPLVVVGIGYDTDAPFATSNRFRDFTVPADPDELLQRGDGSAWPPGGEAEVFLDFLSHDIKPFIQQQLPIHPGKQALFGHSLGGLFTMHVLLTRPFEFQTYIAGSPSLWWKNGYLFDVLSSFSQRMLAAGAIPGYARCSTTQAAIASIDVRTDLQLRVEGRKESDAGTLVKDTEGLVQDAENQVNNTRVLLAVGGREKPHMIADADKMYRHLQEMKQDLPHFQVDYGWFEKEGHVSILPGLFNLALQYILGEHPGKLK
ncbi:alpha/beta hydrolase [Paenibacillus senegalensis]|uniref:alpha/beta hydrolase n=1 Tax=Paenibacillus senegalensis TaxID=1465766 RepID=UPI0002894D19|nr:alpha/beta hydrolase-fold protein [Paenibacillus senegalensis]